MPNASQPRAERPSVSLPPPLIYGAGFVIGLALEPFVPASSLPQTVSLAAGVGGLAVWLVLDGWAMLTFWSVGTGIAPVRPTTALVVSGPYRLTRNPMYVGMAFLYAGLALALDAPWALVFLPGVLLIVDRFVIAREERYLEAKFGDEYRAYSNRVRRWV